MFYVRSRLKAFLLGKPCIHSFRYPITTLAIYYNDKTIVIDKIIRQIGKLVK